MSDSIAVEPAAGAGLALSDPPQDGVSQSPTVVVVGDVDELPDPEVI
jgi:hypothetical protein